MYSIRRTNDSGRNQNTYVSSYSGSRTGLLEYGSLWDIGASDPVRDKYGEQDHILMRET